MIGSRWMPSVHTLREFLARNQLPYEFFDIESSDERGREARELADKAAALPLVIMPDGARLDQSCLERSGPAVRSQDRSDPDDLRCRDRRRWTGGTGRGRLRGIRRTHDHAARSRGARRPGRDIEQNRKLSWFPFRNLGPRSGPPRADPGTSLRSRSAQSDRREEPQHRRALPPARTAIPSRGRARRAAISRHCPGRLRATASASSGSPSRSSGTTTHSST